MGNLCCDDRKDGDPNIQPILKRTERTRSQRNRMTNIYRLFIGILVFFACLLFDRLRACLNNIDQGCNTAVGCWLSSATHLLVGLRSILLSNDGLQQFHSSSWLHNTSPQVGKQLGGSISVKSPIPAHNTNEMAVRKCWRSASKVGV